jgi:hypothetical protein
MLPSAQGVQAAEPVTEKVPAGHGRAAVWSAFGTDPASTVVQCEAPAASAMVPSVQGAHSSAPNSALEPGSHATHEIPSAPSGTSPGLHALQFA